LLPEVPQFGASGELDCRQSEAIGKGELADPPRSDGGSATDLGDKHEAKDRSPMADIVPTARHRRPRISLQLVLWLSPFPTFVSLSTCHPILLLFLPRLYFLSIHKCICFKTLSLLIPLF